MIDKCLSKNIYAGILTWIGSLDPHQIPLKYVGTKLVPKSTFPCKLVPGKRDPLLSQALLGDAAVCVIDAHKAIVVAAALFPVLKTI